jgi:hypothetical protein
MSNYSLLLSKMAELKTLTAEYKTLTTTYRPVLSNPTLYDTADKFVAGMDKYTHTPDINAISSTATPLVTKPGEDYGQSWKYVGKVVPVPGAINNNGANSQKCWNMAANDPHLFKKVAYTGKDGVNQGQSEWDNRCYGLMYDAPADAEYTTSSPGYSYMVGNKNADGTAAGSNIYTKLGIGSTSDTTNIGNASKIYDLQLRVNSLVQDIASLSDSGINTELNTLISSAADASTLIDKINTYMNTSASDISGNYNTIDKRKEINNIYSEINEQTTLRARKYKFIFYIVIGICIIFGYASYTSKLSILDQIDTIKQYMGWGWWTNWWVIAIVVVLFIISSFGWDMKGTLLMIIRYLTDTEFWTGQLWWVGITFILLLIIFFYATFKTFFTEIGAGLKGIQSNF